jgi:alpha-galactosidase
LFENCASGGNRFDLGMLSFMAQGWVSDMSEPVGRLPIITGATHLYPLSVLASYIGPTPSHQNHRVTSLKTRFEVGCFCAARGISLNSADINQQFDELVTCAKEYLNSATDVVNGRFRRLLYGENEYCWQLSNAEETVIYLGYFHILSGVNLPYRRVRLRGLDTSANYKRRDTGDIFAGSALMHMGLDLPYVHVAQVGKDVDYMSQGDFSSWLCILEKC